jgi:hypothetical protein
MLVSEIPSNLRIDMSGDRRGVMVVDSDLYKIADRIKEIDPNLYIVFHEKHPQPFTIMENCKDGVSRFVARYEELDQRILDDLRYMLSVPFDERLKRVEREIDAKNAALEAIDDETLDWLASEMRRDLVKSGFSTPIGFTSYPLAKKKKG